MELWAVGLLKARLAPRVGAGVGVVAWKQGIESHGLGSRAGILAREGVARRTQWVAQKEGWRRGGRTRSGWLKRKGGGVAHEEWVAQKEEESSRVRERDSNLPLHRRAETQPRAPPATASSTGAEVRAPLAHGRSELSLPAAVGPEDQIKLTTLRKRRAKKAKAHATSTGRPHRQPWRCGDWRRSRKISMPISGDVLHYLVTFLNRHCSHHDLEARTFFARLSFATSERNAG